MMVQEAEERSKERVIERIKDEREKTCSVIEKKQVYI
jgi:hypothetical protein